MKNSVELKQLVDDQYFIESMNKAFSDLRADYELTMDTSMEKIKELNQLHVDIKNHLSDLTSLSRKSSGTVCGLRGTGKTHLMLLARHNLNSSLWESERDNNLCIYLNMKRLCLPDNCDDDTFNRVFSIFVYEEISTQLLIILKKLKRKPFLEKVQRIFNKKEKNLQSNLEKAVACIYNMIAIAHEGNEQIRNIGVGSYEKEDTNKEMYELVSELNGTLKELIPGGSITFNENEMSEIATRLRTNNIYYQYLNVKSVRNQLIDIISLLGIDSITFYVDEWEKISSINKCQERTATYIDKIMDDPLYFWIGIVPYRGGLYCLDNGADLQHQINLDESLIYEASEQEKILCVNYFKEIVNKRLDYYFPDKEYTYKIMFNSEENFAKLVMASMGNTRDFGTMLLKCWSGYQAYRKSALSPGRPFKYISAQMIVDAIKDNGDKKFSNIEDENDVVKVWNDIKNYCISKKSSHFAIEEKTESLECLREREFSELIYHRLLHMRKAHVPAKDTDVENKLSIYAINYAATYSLHSQDKKMSFIVEYKTIHDRVRRYIYNPQEILNKIRITNGKIFPCSSCSAPINPNLMKAAWDRNSCPFCGGKIYRDNV